MAGLGDVIGGFFGIGDAFNNSFNASAQQAANEAIDELNTQMYNNAVELATQSDNQILDNNKEMLDQVAEDLGLALEDQAALWNSYAKDVTKNLEEISRGQQAIANNEAYTPNLSAINPSNYHKKSKTSGVIFSP